MNDYSDQLVAELVDRLRSPLDPVLSEPTRLRIQAALKALPADGAMSFTALGKVLKVTDGNLGLHLGILTDAAFVEKQEHWRGKRRTTLYRSTAAGHVAFDAHVRALEAITRISHVAQGPVSDSASTSVPAAGPAAGENRRQ